MSLLERVLEPEVMDDVGEALAYDAMDHSQVNATFVADLAAFAGGENLTQVLDVGTGTAQMPVCLCEAEPDAEVVAIDLAKSMLELADRNVAAAKLEKRIRLKLVDSKQLPFADGSFRCVISNSIIHHIPEPQQALSEMVRVLAPGGILFVRDLLRPDSDAHVRELVTTYAAGESPYITALFDASLRAALTLEEVQELALPFQIPAASVAKNSDRHWTIAYRKPGAQPHSKEATPKTARHSIAQQIVAHEGGNS